MPPPLSPMHTSTQSRGAAVFLLPDFAPPKPRLAAFLSRRPPLGTLARVLLALSIAPLASARLLSAQIDTDSIAPHRYLIVYRNATIPGDAAARAISAGAHLLQRDEASGVGSLHAPASQDDPTTRRLLAAQPNVAYVLHDRIVSAHRLLTRAIRARPGTSSSSSTTTIGRPHPHRPLP